MSNAETETQQLVISDRQRMQLESGGLDAGSVAKAVGDSLTTSCINEQKSPPSRYNEQLGRIENVERDDNAECGYSIDADEETLALSYLCTRSGDLCGRRSTLTRTTAELVNRVAVYCVPQAASIG